MTVATPSATAKSKCFQSSVKPAEPRKGLMPNPPPSRTSVWPLIATASGEARKATATATSSGSSARPSGICATSAASACSSSRSVAAAIRSTARRIMSVRTKAGQTAFAVTPVPVTSAATARISPTAACFAAVYAAV